MRAAQVTIRPAREEEAALLTDLALRSKAHWGYDAEFMRDALPDMTVAPEYVSANPVSVAQNEEGIIAFYSLKRAGEDVELDNLFVEPQFIGQGLGRLLWGHAVREAKRLGFRRMLVVSEPFAEGFYLALGAKRIGERPSNVRRGRALPLLEYALADCPSVTSGSP